MASCNDRLKAFQIEDDWSVGPHHECSSCLENRCETLTRGYSENLKIFGFRKQKQIKYNPCLGCKLDMEGIVRVNEPQVLAGVLFYQGT